MGLKEGKCSSLSDYIVLVVTSIGISVCLSGAIFGSIKGNIEPDMAFIKSNIKSFWELIGTHADELDTLRARVYDLENKLKEMENHNDR